jgi:hypothetical protein
MDFLNRVFSREIAKNRVFFSKKHRKPPPFTVLAFTTIETGAMFTLALPLMVNPADAIQDVTLSLFAMPAN